MPRHGRFPAAAVIASDPVPAAREAFSRETGCPATPDNRAVVQQSSVLVLAVKPQTMTAVLADVRELVEKRRPLVVSIAAGITLAQLQAGLGPGIAGCWARRADAAIN